MNATLATGAPPLPRSDAIAASTASCSGTNCTRSAAGAELGPVFHVALVLAPPMLAMYVSGGSRIRYVTSPPASICAGSSNASADATPVSFCAAQEA